MDFIDAREILSVSALPWFFLPSVGQPFSRLYSVKLNMKLAWVWDFGVSLQNRICRVLSFVLVTLQGGGTERGVRPAGSANGQGLAEVLFKCDPLENQAGVNPRILGMFPLPRKNTGSSQWELLSKLRRAVFYPYVTQRLKLLVYFMCKAKLSACRVPL